MAPIAGARPPRPRLRFGRSVLTHGVASALCFYLGLLFGYHASHDHVATSSDIVGGGSSLRATDPRNLMRKILEEREKCERRVQEALEVQELYKDDAYEKDDAELLREEYDIEGEKEKLEDDDVNKIDDDDVNKNDGEGDDDGDVEPRDGEEEVDDVEALEGQNGAEALEKGDDAKALEDGDDVEALEDGDDVEASEEGDEAEALEDGDDVEALEEGDNVEALEYGDDAEVLEEEDDVEALDGDDAEVLEEGDGVEALEEGDDTESVAEGDDTEAMEGDKIDALKERRHLEAPRKVDDEGAEEETYNAEAKKGGDDVPRFGSNLSGFLAGMARTPKIHFLSRFDYGWPTDLASPASRSEALILYHSSQALPHGKEMANSAASEAYEVPLLLPEMAVDNCDQLNVVTVGNGGGEAKCTAIVGQYAGYHVGRFLREGQGDERGMRPPLVHVGRGRSSNGGNEFAPPKLKHIHAHWKRLRTYLENYEEVAGELRPILERVAPNNDPVVVMVCNKGQSDLLANFACAARSKGIALTNVLVFAADETTEQIAKGLGMEVYYDRHNFHDLPEKEAASYGDDVFTSMMFAKIVCVQMVNMLGHDVLFQDVDVVWYRDPLAIFRDATSPLAHYDMLFQDDGARSARYAPFCANSGFYYVRHNDRTQYLLASLLYHGDEVLAFRSHQQALNALLTEHASLYGLRVKTLDGQDFPGGFHYHRKKDFMKEVASGTRVPWIFHMSWTHNKDNKLLFLKQMGLWYLQETCGLFGNKAVDPDAAADSIAVDDVVAECCAAKPLVSCHYRDKPSVNPCDDSPPIDKGGKSFWTVTVQ